nr:MAG TPA: Single strand binding protein [Caudoviricetes sp.]
MNCVNLIGRLVKDVDVRTTKSGTSVAGFILAVDKGLSKQKREKAEQAGRPTADFISCQAWGMTADLLSRYCGKGSKIAIEGRIQTGSYQDKETGKTIYTTDAVADRVEFLDSKSTSSQDDRVPDDDFFDDDFDDDFVDQAYNESIPF